MRDVKSIKMFTAIINWDCQSDKKTLSDVETSLNEMDYFN